MVISNGLGTPHDAWPAINERTESYRVFTWDHRGLGGSERPADESRITIADHTDDCLAVMDFYGVDRAVVIGWSVGVNIAFEAAVRDQRRIAGMLAVAGVPGGTFEALLHPLPRSASPARRSSGIPPDAIPRSSPQPSGQTDCLLHPMGGSTRAA